MREERNAIKRGEKDRKTVYKEGKNVRKSRNKR